MYQLEYADIEEDSVADARAREKQLLERSVILLQEAKGSGHGSMAVVEATHFVRRLWTALLQDLSDTENQLPAELKASLISVGIWIIKEVERIRQGESEDFDGIIEISETIMKGL